MEARALRAAYMREWRQKRGELELANVRARYRRSVESGTYWRDRNKERVLARRREVYRRGEYPKHLKRMYGITPEDYGRMVAEQGDKCAICRTDEPPKRGGKPQQWHVDHDHATGNVRGLLCHHCNAGLGNFGDSEARLLAAINYLSRTMAKVGAA